MGLFEDDDEKDIFTQQDPAEEPKPVKKPRLTPDNPDYWDSEEGRWEHLKVFKSVGKYLYLLAAAAIVAVVGMLVVWATSPYINEASQYGYIDHVERHGYVFKSYEAGLLTYKSINDTSTTDVKDLEFSAMGTVGHKLKKYCRSGVPVKVDYKVYKFAMPWRGCRKVVAVNVDSISADSIIPPFKNKPKR